MSINSVFFSIIIPTYNRAEKLRRALASLESQSFKEFEVIVCDDGSTDDTARVVELFVDKFLLHYIREENWGGPARPRNNGIKVARGQWICFLDSDDWWYPEKLASIMDFVGVSDVIHHDGDVYTDKGKKFRAIKGRQLIPPAFVDLMSNGNALINSSVCVRRSVLDNVGYFTERSDLISIEDYDLWLRISRVTEAFTHIPAKLCAYWKGNDNISADINTYIQRLSIIQQLHSCFLEEMFRGESGVWFTYLLGKCYLQLGNPAAASEYFLTSSQSSRMRYAALSKIYFCICRAYMLTGANRWRGN
ncbi:MAG: glycosyltransferase family A protein [Desulfuromonadales bacterium]